jgi:hypothetical protein
MITLSGSDDIEGAIAPKAKLSERPREVRAPVKESVEAWHVAIPWPSGVVAYHAHCRPNVAISTAIPPIYGRDFQTSVLQYLKQPS